jgi:hypothetical protein
MFTKLISGQVIGEGYFEKLTSNHNGSVLQNLEILASNQAVCAISVKPKCIEAA